MAKFMLPSRLRPALAALLTSALLAACGGGGSSASAPQNFKVYEGDGQVTVTWDQESDVEYWLFYAPTADLTLDSWKKITGAQAKVGDKGKGISSPYIVTGLTNGVVYDFIINGRKSGGEGGPGADAPAVTPRPAGGIWQAAKTSPATTMRSVAYGTNSDNSTATFVAVGDGGKIYSSTDVPTYVGTSSWTAVSTAITATLNGAAYGLSKYIAVGEGGKIYYSSNTTTWTEGTTTTSQLQNLNAVAVPGSVAIAVGNQGTIVSSTDAASWTVRRSSGKDLFGVAYSASGLWVAVGADCTIVTSSDGATWTAASVPGTCGTGTTLKGVAVMSTTATSTGYSYMAVGTGGTILTSIDGTTWTAASSPVTADLNAVAASTRFVAVGNAGTTLQTDANGAWQVIPNNTTTNAVTGSDNLYGLLRATAAYIAVGSKTFYSYN